MADDPPSTFVFLYGPPAVGKATIGRLLADRTGFALAQNHSLIDAITPVFGFGTDGFVELVARFRAQLFETAARDGLDVVVTYCYAPEDEPEMRGYVDSIRKQGGRVLFAQLAASDASLRARVIEPSRRAHGKLVDVASLDEVLARWDFSQPVPFEPSLRLDTDALTPAEAAESIIREYGLERRGLG